MKHFDSLHCIEQIEQRDIMPLVEQGKARLVHSSQGSNNPDFGQGIDSGYYVKTYEIILRTKLNPVCFAINISFAYDRRYNRGKMIMSSQHALMLWQAYANFSAEEQRRTIAQMIRYGGEDKPCRQTVAIK